MLQYILECIAFQLVFLIIYDFFLKRETFFQLNRFYLIGTYFLSMVLPWIKIEALKTTVPQDYYVYPEFLLNRNDLTTGLTLTEESIFFISWEAGILYGGMFLATLYFTYKLYQLHKLRRNGNVKYFPDFTRIVVENSELAFSFFKSIFLGDKVVAREHQSIIQHELVHIEQKHSCDLLFFELMRIVGWFNPLVYVYQSRVSELHEFIADAKVSKTHKREQYDLLLSQVFQTENISFVNQFFKSSLIKKRIVMLQKSRSKQFFRLKYLLLVPVVVGMLFYTSSEAQEKDQIRQKQTGGDTELIERVNADIDKELENTWSIGMVNRNFEKGLDSTDGENVLSKESYFKRTLLFQRYFEHFADSLEKARTPFFRRDEFPKRRLPSTVMYNSYVNRTKAFQLLDKNLDVSIDRNKHEVQVINGIDAKQGRPLTFKVNDLSDLKGYEILLFNRRINEISKKESSYDNVVLTDGKNIIRVGPKIVERYDGRSVTKDYFTFPIVERTIPFATVDEVPIFPGCEDDADKRGCFYENMREHIRKHFNYPKEAQDKKLHGRVAILFTMNTEGGISNIKTRGPHKLLEDEAARIISKLPEIKPGIHEGKKVNVTFSIPISFRLSGNNTKGKTDPMTKYQELARERSRLLKSADEDNPIIKNLDEQIERVKQEILANHDGTVPFAWIDNVPLFPGCENAEDPRDCFQTSMQKHISKNFRYPQEAQEKGIQGRVNIMFTMDKEGNITDIRKRGPDKLLEDEAVRIISLLPKLKPGIQGGEKVNVPFSIPITFKLQGEGKNDKAMKLTGDNELNPIYIVDGVELSKEEFEKLKVENIASMTILKEESATKKYGQEAKNGVVEIKMKKKD